MGCGFAGYILRCVLAARSQRYSEMPRKLRSALWPMIATSRPKDPRRFVARGLAAATAAWKRGIENISGEFNVEKTVALVNRPRARRAVAAALAEFGVRTASVARDLGGFGGSCAPQCHCPGEAGAQHESQGEPACHHQGPA